MATITLPMSVLALVPCASKDSTRPSITALHIGPRWVEVTD
jgi:hypothetical protein